MPERVVYLDNDHTVTVADIKTVSDGIYWADILRLRVQSINDRINAPGYKSTRQDRQALHFRKVALTQVRQKLQALQQPQP